MKIIKRIFGYRKQWCTLHSGRGHTQGTGLDIKYEEMHILGFRFISDIVFSADTEWLRCLKIRLQDDDAQQLKEN